MVAFTSSGQQLWNGPSDTPQIATADGGVIATYIQPGPDACLPTIYGGAVTFDQNGNQTGQMGSQAMQSWPGNSYQIGSVEQVIGFTLDVATSFSPFQGANPSGSGTATQQPWYAALKSCPGAATPCPQEAIMSALNALQTLMSPQQTCTLCNIYVFNSNKLPGTSQSARWAALPDALYEGITFTMPDILWPFFRDNPSLARALPALAAEVIRAQVGVRHGLRVGVIAILHTFNGKLEFNSHVHTMITGGGLHGSFDTWAPRAYYNHDRLMKAWRKAVIALLRAAIRASRLRTEITCDQMGDLLTHVERCWWSIKIQPFEDKWHFLQYAGRYLRRPPIAQRRITWIGEQTVRFWYKDKRLRRGAVVQCSLEEFIDRWAQHIPEHYQHAVRSFGLFAPRALSQTSAAIFAILGQERKPRPKPRRWADSIKRDFGHDPLLDHTGKRMQWLRRIKAKATP